MTIAVYLRVSTDAQTERQTILGQRQYAEERLRGEPLLWYEDDGVSGGLPVEKRPAGTRLLQDAEARRFALVCVYKVDRLARSLLELLRCVETFDRYGVALRSLSEPFDTSTAIGRTFLQLLGSFAELERNLIRERTMGGKGRKAAEGGWMGGTVPFGYRLVSNRFEEEAWEAEIVREVFQLCIDGYTTARIAALLNARGVPNPRSVRSTRLPHSHTWNHTTVGNILRNTAYYGEGRFRGGRIIVPVPALVEGEQWRQARAALRSRRNVQHGLRPYPLTGFLRCALCGASASGVSVNSGSGTRFNYYRCTRDPRGGRKCLAPHLKADWVEGELWGQVQAVLRNPAPAVEALRYRLQARQQEAPPLTELERLDQAEGEKAAERGRIINLVRRGLVTDEEAEGELRTLQAEVETLRERRAALQARVVTDEEIEARVGELGELLGRLRDLAETTDALRQREAFRRLLVRAEIGREGRQPFVRPTWIWPNFVS